MLSEFMKNLPTQTTADITYYINSTAGDDDNDGLTSGEPFETLEYAISLLTNKTINHNITLTLVNSAAAFDVLTLDSFKGKGSIILVSTTSFDIEGLSFTDCTCNIEMETFTVTDVIEITRCKSVSLKGLVSDTVTGTGVNVVDSNVVMTGCDIQSATVRNLLVEGEADVSIEDCDFEVEVGEILIKDGATLYEIGTGNTHNTFDTTYNGQVLAIDRTA